MFANKGLIFVEVGLIVVILVKYLNCSSGFYQYDVTIIICKFFVND